MWQQSLRVYLQIKHPYEVGALRIIFDKTQHPGVLQVPWGGAVRQSHEQLCHRRGHRLKHTHKTLIFWKHPMEFFFSFLNSSWHVNNTFCGQVLLPSLNFLAHMQAISYEAKFGWKACLHALETNAAAALWSQQQHLFLTPEEETLQPPFPVDNSLLWWPHVSKSF